MSRKAHRTEWIYGLHAVESAVRHQPESVLQLWMQQGRHDKRFARLAQLAADNGLRVQAVGAEKLRNRAGKGRHQGVVAEVRITAQTGMTLEDCLGLERCLLLILDEVQDPHNIGACLRTADAFGVDAVIVSRNRSPSLNPVIRKVASGAAETVPYIEVSNLVRAIDRLRDHGVWVVGSSGDADTPLTRFEAGPRLALVMGSEGKGMRRLTRESCDQLVAIPMQGSVESLNVSVATGICLFELRRQSSVAASNG